MKYKTKDEVIKAATMFIREEMDRGDAMTTPAATTRYLTLKIGTLEYEVFGILHLDNRHRIIEDEVMFRGTVDGTAVYPREVAKSCLNHNSAAVIYHNHPSGVAEPSTADRDLTRRLIEALGLLDIRVLDHIVVGGTEYTSFAERGWI